MRKILEEKFYNISLSFWTKKIADLCLWVQWGGGKGWKVKHDLRVTSLNPRVTSSNSRVRSSNSRVRTLKAPVAIKARVEAMKRRVR